MNWYIKVLQQYADFNGRARRKEYWMFTLISVLISTVLSFIEGMLGFASDIGTSILSGIYSLAILIPSIAVGVRRMHDVGKSGWYLLIPFYNFVLAITEGQAGENQYGQDPKAVDFSN